MRRALLIFLMWLVPLQAVWSAGHAMHEHFTAAAHAHDHDHDFGHEHGHDHYDDSFFDIVENMLGAHDEDGQHGNHGHAAFSFMVSNIELGLSNTLAAQPPPAPPASFTSHIPLLPDPPPAVRI
jgi:hypothetical protein